jgi:hypothetical protein
MLKKLSRIFLGVQNVEEMKKQGLLLSLAVPAFRWADWALVGATGMFVAMLKKFGISDIGIFLILWIANVMIELLIVKGNDKTKVDFTLAEGLRRLADAAIAKSKLSGVILETLIFVRLLVWDGSAFVVIFFNRKLKTFSGKITVLIICSAVQMSIWTTLYILGYNGFSDMISKFIH